MRLNAPDLALISSWNFDAAVARIIENPFLYQIIEDDIRRAPDNEIVMIARTHGHRHPKRSQERVPE